MSNRTHGKAGYDKEFKINALRTLRDHEYNVRQSAGLVGVEEMTLTKWKNSEWGKLELGKMEVEDKSKIINTGMDAILTAKVDHLQSEFKFFKELEDLMVLLIEKYNELIPLSTKLSDVNEAFKNIADVYLKAINNNINKDGDNSQGSEKRQMVLNMIKNQLVVAPDIISGLLPKK
jgi:hypothetical protein